MSMPDFESKIVDAISRRVDQANGHLVIRLQQSGDPGPDIVVHNQDSGRSLAIEIKRSVGALPLSLYPQLKELSEDCARRGDDFIVLSDAPPSGVLETNASTAHISIVQVKDTEDAMQVLEPRIRLLNPQE